MCLDKTKICKICILSGQIKSNRDRMDGIKMDIDLIIGKINESTVFIDGTSSMRKVIKSIEEKVSNIEKEQLDFSGFIKPDLTNINKEQKEEKNGERK